MADTSLPHMEVLGGTSTEAQPETELADPITTVPQPDEGAADTDDEGSDFDTSSVYTETTSIASDITKYREENGRRYHNYGLNEHWGPNDEHAQDQQDLSHHLWTLVLNGKLYLAPVVKPQRILDLGTGTGIWAMDVADQEPQAEVKGIDLSPIQPSWIPPNVKFEVDDYNMKWLDENKYDLVHARELLGSVPDWVKLYKNILTALKPGGWVDQSEPSIYLESTYVQLPDDHVYRKWGALMSEAGRKSGMRFDIGPDIKGWMEEAGFINVKEIRVPWPVGTWPKDRHQRGIGQVNQLRIEQGVLDFCARRFTNKLGWSPEEVEVFGAYMRNAVKNNKLLAHEWSYFVYGQKPLSVD